MQCRSLRLSSLYPSTYPCQFFDSDTLAGAFSLFDNAFADNVVGVSGKAFLFAREFPQATARRLCAFGLQLAAQLAMAITNRLDAFALVDCACAINGDVGDTEIDTQKAVYVIWRRFFHLTGGEQIKLAVNQAQVSFTALPCQEFQLSLSTHKGDSQATTRRPNADLLLGQEPAQDTRIVGNAAMWPERALALLVHFVGIGNLADGAYNDLGSQASRFTNGGVYQLLKAKLIEGAFLPSHLANLIARGVGRFQRFKEVFMLFNVGLQLHFGGQFHASSVAQMGRFIKCLTVWIQKTAQFLPQLKQWASLRQRS